MAITSLIPVLSLWEPPPERNGLVFLFVFFCFFFFFVFVCLFVCLFFSYLATAEIVCNLLYSKGEKKITKSSVPYTYTSVGLSTAL